MHIVLDIIDLVRNVIVLARLLWVSTRHRKAHGWEGCVYAKRTKSLCLRCY